MGQWVQVLVVKPLLLCKDSTSFRFESFALVTGSIDRSMSMIPRHPLSFTAIALWRRIPSNTNGATSVEPCGRPGLLPPGLGASALGRPRPQRNSERHRRVGAWSPVL